MRVVALGGGHGLAASLSALRHLSDDLTAIVTVADNGGSSGRLREEFGALPPGDLRMALAALCGDDEWGQTWARVLQHRFTSDGALSGHATGNLLIVALWELLGDHVDGLSWIGRLLGAQGRVLPMATTPLDITAQVRGSDATRPDDVVTVRGQADVATAAGEVISVSLDPAEPAACPEALEAIGRADWVVLGPGSWFTSVLPHFLVPQLRQALSRTPARVVVTLNLEAPPGETEGYTPQDHLEVLLRHAPDLAIDTVLVDDASVVDADALRVAARDAGARLAVADVADQANPGSHETAKLTRAYAEIMGAN